MSRWIWMILSMLVLMPACTQFPELDAAVSPEAQNAPPPDFKPSDQLLAAATPTDAASDDQTDEELAARAAALQARANRLRQTP